MRTRGGWLVSWFEVCFEGELLDMKGERIDGSFGFDVRGSCRKSVWDDGER